MEAQYYYTMIMIMIMGIAMSALDLYREVRYGILLTGIHRLGL